MSLRARYWTLVAAWFVVPPLLVLGALAVSPLCWVLLGPARAWPPRHPGFAFDTHCHRCRHDLSSEGRRA